jgi:hypothetical protein
MTQKTITKAELEKLIRESINEQIGRRGWSVEADNQHAKDVEEQYIQRQQACIREIQSLVKEFVAIQNTNFKKIKSPKLDKLAWKIEEVFEKELGRMRREPS